MHKGYKVRVWLKSAQINYLKPGRTDLFFTIDITQGDIEEVEHVLNTIGKHTKAYPIEMYNKEGELCVSVFTEVYIRNLGYSETNDTVSI
jgi:hypothetical protein